MKWLTIFNLVALSLLVESLSYRNAKYVEFEVKIENQMNAVKELELSSNFKFLDPVYVINSKVELIIMQDGFVQFSDLAEDHQIEFNILTNDVQSWFDDERPLKQAKSGFAFNRYNTFEEILDFLNQTHAQFPVITELFSIGQSFEGRELMALKITKNASNPIVFIDANIHAREWISSATAVWVINEILTTTDLRVRNILDQVNFVIIPMLNPDGYIYTYNVDRMWRKTRSTHSSLLCTGADPNRNFAYNWMMTGASAVPCTDTYGGLFPYSEPESKALNDFYATLYENVKIYLSFHSAVQSLLYPWGHIGTYDNMPNKDHLDEVAIAAIAALTARHGTAYIYGSSYNTLSPAAGTSKDHMYGFYGTPISYTFEMRRAKVGERFVLPPEEIIPNSEEVFDGLVAMIEKTKELGYF